MGLFRKKKNKYQVTRNTLHRAAKDYAPDRIELEIGDAQQDEFYPQAKIKRWDNETNFSIRRDNGARSFQQKGDRIIASADKEDVAIYELEGFEDGGLEFEIHLKEKPDTNKFDFTLQTKGLDFFYQPELTDEEKENGAVRPENVVGSYAAYHKEKKNNLVGGKEYKTGKAFHIYRPHAVDKRGEGTWCELYIDEQTLSVTVPQDFLEKAVYPVVVDPTFGYTSVGGTSDQVGLPSTSPVQIGSWFNLSEDGDVSSASVYASYTYDSSAGIAGSDVAIYTKTGDPSGTFQNSTPGDSVSFDYLKPSSNFSAQWNDFNYSSSLSLTSGDYWIFFSAEGNSGYLSDSAYLIRYDSASPGKSFRGLSDMDHKLVSGTTWQSSFSASAWWGNERVYSLYATYTASSAAETSTHTTDALIQAEQTATHTTDTLTVQQSTATHTTDVLVVEENTASHTTDTLTKATESATHTTDTFVGYPIHPANHSLIYGGHSYGGFNYAGGTFEVAVPIESATHTTDTLVKAAETATHTTDTYSVDHTEASHTTDTYSVDHTEASHTTDSLIVEVTTATHTTDALVKATEAPTHTTDTLVSADNAVSHNTDTLVKVNGLTATHSTDTLVKSILTSTHTTDAYVVVQETTTHTTDTLVKENAVTSTHTTDAYAVEQKTATHTTDTLVALAISHTTDTFVCIPWYYTDEVSSTYSESDVVSSTYTEADVETTIWTEEDKNLGQCD